MRIRYKAIVYVDAENELVARELIRSGCEDKIHIGEVIEMKEMSRQTKSEVKG